MGRVSRVRAPSSDLYASMARIRAFETALVRLWADGRISGELHTGMGEEGIVAGVLAHVVDGDALALDHRSTPPLVARGVDLDALLAECLGTPDGLGGGAGGHMHLFSAEHLAGSSGIVGASGPTATGFGLAAQMLRPGAIAVAFFGEGAMNQGMLLEALNLAVVWRLPVLFVCKDSGWSITTRSERMTGGSLVRRARAFGMPGVRVDGTRVGEVWKAAGRLIGHTRVGRGPAFLLARCKHLRGHFEDDAFVRAATNPLALRTEAPGVLRAMRDPDVPVATRAAGLATMIPGLFRMALEQRIGRGDPLVRARRALGGGEADRLDEAARAEVDAAVARLEAAA